MEYINFGGVFVLKKIKTVKLSSIESLCKLTTTLMTIIISLLEKAESSLTGKIANVHKSRYKCSEIQEKKQLNPLKT